MKSPIKNSPLNNPGDSLEREINSVFYDDIITYSMFAGFAGILAAMEWWRWYINALPSPWTYTIIAFPIVLFSAVKVRKGIIKIRRLRQGRDGEKAVGQCLEQLRTREAIVFHDIPGEGFNLDHVVCHSSGIYVIETKTYSKPDKGESKIIYDGKSISLHGRTPDKRPLIQVKAASTWLSALLNSSTGKHFAIQPVVVFPGWFIQNVGKAKSSNIWVLNPKALPAFMSNRESCLTSEDVKLAAHHLSLYVRAQKGK